MSLENPQHNLFRRKITFALFAMKTTAIAVPFHRTLCQLELDKLSFDGSFTRFD